MDSSEDECESLPQTVSNYYFVNSINEPISFSQLPVQISQKNIEKKVENPKNQIFIHGTVEGLQKIYKQVLAWKFDLSNAKPEVFVLSKDNNWIQLLKPRKSFEDIIRSILVTVWVLGFLRKKPEASGKTIWDQLSKDFSSYETRPSENDLIEHIALISEAVKQDETLAQSKFLVTFLEKPQKKNDENIGTIPSTPFIVDDDMVDEFDGDDGSDDEEDLYDTVCAICDNGGDIICCDGRCMRSFHATEDAGSDSYCESLGWSDEQVEATQSFICKNCQHKQHQCFACGKLGSSDKLSVSGAEVFPCVSATCGRFYHLPCVAKLLHRDNAAEAEELQKKVSAGGTFTCPIHKCIVCKLGEDKTDPDLQFAVCRRCPKSYHRKCLPREIGFEDDEDEDILQRAWEGLIPNRILIYCLNHDIDDELKTPLRNHIKFPGDELKRKKQESQQLPRREKFILKKKSLTSEDELRKKNLSKVQKGVHSSSSVEKLKMSKQSVRASGYGSLKKSEEKDTSTHLGNRLYEYYNKSFKGLPEKEQKEKVIGKPAAMDRSSSFQLDNESKRRIQALMEDATSSVTLEQIVEKHKMPQTHGVSMKSTVDKTITLGKVEGSVEAIRAAIQKLEEGGSIEDAKAVCEPVLLHQINRWKNKMKVYLSPFLYGMRYTSFGRHFTKVDKLKEIVNMLHCYVQDNDMIVDFCCGANDFSWLMKTKLEELGKKCLYRNYDILQSKNDFNFEKRDWMNVKTDELPDGSRLIMGLNPPFGVNASLANKFIDKALEFKPKLLILIVPKETERLDTKKKMPYDLIWEDNELLAGKSFYLPGSVDAKDNQMEDWNNSPPPLYLWSRPDWTAKHMAIAQKYGHLSTLRESSQLQDEKKNYKPSACGSPPKDCDLANLAPKPVNDHQVANLEQVPSPLTRQNISENLEDALHDDVNMEVDKDSTHLRDEMGEDSKKRKHDKNEPVKGPLKKLDTDNEREQLGKESGKVPQRKQKRGGKKSGRYATDDKPSRLPESRSEREVSREREYHQEKEFNREREYPQKREVNREREYHQEREVSTEREYHIGQNLAGPGSLPRTGYKTSHMDENEMRHRLTSDELYAGPTNRWSGPSPDYGARNLEEHYAGNQRDSLDSHGFRSPPVGIQDHYARTTATSRAGLYESQDSQCLDRRSNFLGSGQETAYISPYNRMGSNMNPLMSSSTMQRYAPRLDEMNHTRTNVLGYDQFGVGRPENSGYEQFGVARTGNSGLEQFGAARTGNPGYDQFGLDRTGGFDQFGVGRPGNPGLIGSVPDHQYDLSGFAPRPRSFTPHNSSGWLNE